MKDTAAVITVSDKAVRGERIDTSGPALCELLKRDGWDVLYTTVVPDEAEEINVVRKKQFSIKPMSVEEAILQMNLLEHEFFAFRDEAADGAFSVVYRRKNGGYGLISDDGE